MSIAMRMPSESISLYILIFDIQQSVWICTQVNVRPRESQTWREERDGVQSSLSRLDLDNYLPSHSRRDRVNLLPNGVNTTKRLRAKYGNQQQKDDQKDYPVHKACLKRFDTDLKLLLRLKQEVIVKDSGRVSSKALSDNTLEKVDTYLVLSCWIQSTYETSTQAWKHGRRRWWTARKWSRDQSSKDWVIQATCSCRQV